MSLGRRVSAILMLRLAADSLMGVCKAVEVGPEVGPNCLPAEA